MSTSLNNSSHVSVGGGIMRRLNFGTGAITGVIGALIAWYAARHLLNADGQLFDDQVTTLMGCGWVVGFLLGIGALTAPGKWASGRDQSHDDEMFLAGKGMGTARYWRDRKSTRLNSSH
mgnify:FL=1